MADEEEVKKSEYPKWVDHPTELDKRGFPLRVVVKDEKAEQALGNGNEPKGKAPKGGWPTKD